MINPFSIPDSSGSVFLLVTGYPDRYNIVSVHLVDGNLGLLLEILQPFFVIPRYKKNPIKSCWRNLKSN